MINNSEGDSPHVLLESWLVSYFRDHLSISVSPEIECFLIILNFVGVGEPYDVVAEGVQACQEHYWNRDVLVAVEKYPFLS